MSKKISPTPHSDAAAALCYLSKGLVTSVVGARASPNTVASWTLM